jgi:xanthine dehydrogenase accessory factor
LTPALPKKLRVLVRGGGDLASGVILRCARAGWEVIVTELARPLTVRRMVSFSQTIYDRSFDVESVRAEHAANRDDALKLVHRGVVPVLIDPDCHMMAELHPDVLVDARMLKHAQESLWESVPLLIGLGPGFFAGENCHAVIETVRGPFLGRVIWNGPAEKNSGIPDPVGSYQDERVLRAPTDGVIVTKAFIGDRLSEGDLVAEVGGLPVRSPFAGVLRGLIHDGLEVSKGLKIGDVDPRDDLRLCWLVSDKSLAVGGGVLEAILSWPKFPNCSVRTELE